MLPFSTNSTSSRLREICKGQRPGVASIALSQTGFCGGEVRRWAVKCVVLVSTVNHVVFGTEGLAVRRSLCLCAVQTLTDGVGHRVGRLFAHHPYGGLGLSGVNTRKRKRKRKWQWQWQWQLCGMSEGACLLTSTPTRLHLNGRVSWSHVALFARCFVG